MLDLEAKHKAMNTRWSVLVVVVLLNAFGLTESVAREGNTASEQTKAIAAGNDVKVVLTKVDDGDIQHGQDGIHEDGNLTFLREGSISLTTVEPGRPVKIAVDRTRTFQTMHGDGAALTDSSAWVLMNLKRKNPHLYDYTMKKLFAPAEGAGFSFLRLPMGASDYTANRTYYTYCDRPSADLSLFSIAHDRVCIIPVLKDALRLNPDIRVLGSPWSAPAWMKTNGKLTGISEADKAAGCGDRFVRAVQGAVNAKPSRPFVRSPFIRPEASVATSVSA